MEQEAREVFPVTFFHGEGPVVMGGADFRPIVQFADNLLTDAIAGEEVPITVDSTDEGPESQRTTTKKVEKPGTPAPD